MVCWIKNGWNLWYWYYLWPMLFATTPDRTMNNRKLVLRWETLHSDCDLWIVHMRSESRCKESSIGKKIAFTSTVSYEIFIRTTSNIQRIWHSIRIFDAGVEKFQIVQSSHKRNHQILDWIHGENMTRHTNCAIHLTIVFVFLSKDKQHFYGYIYIIKWLASSISQYIPVSLFHR